MRECGAAAPSLVELLERVQDPRVRSSGWVLGHLGQASLSRRPVFRAGAIVGLSLKSWALLASARDRHECGHHNTQVISRRFGWLNRT